MGEFVGCRAHGVSLGVVYGNVRFAVRAGRRWRVGEHCPGYAHV